MTVQENDIMELEMAAQSKQKRIEQLEKERRSDLQMIQVLSAPEYASMHFCASLVCEYACLRLSCMRVCMSVPLLWFDGSKS
jgi:hypothetical protein